MIPEIQIYKDRPKLLRAARDAVVNACRIQLEEKGCLTMALSGGKTPQPLYQSLTDSGLQIDWDRVHLFMVDERFVAFQHPDSNWGMIYRNLVDHVQIPGENVHPVRILGSARASAEAYTQELKDFFGSNADPFPSLDVMIMGVGQDGHTASLFPGTQALKVADRPVTDAYPENVPQPRITLTFPVIHNAKLLLFIVAGQDKAERMHEILIQKDEQLPATVACQGKGQIVFLMDASAASRL